MDNRDEDSESSEAHIKSMIEEIKNSKDFSYISKAIDDHYKSYKIEYMYNYLDYSSNKYKIRRKITEEMKRKMTEVTCPTCKKAKIMERRGRFGIFYSCADYPNCKFAMKAKPTGAVCKECGSLYMEGTKTIPERCSNKACPNFRPGPKNCR